MPAADRPNNEICLASFPGSAHACSGFAQFSLRRDLQGQPGQSMSGVRNSFEGESRRGWRKT